MATLPTTSLVLGALLMTPYCQPGDKTGGSTDATMDPSTGAVTDPEDTTAPDARMIEIGPPDQADSDPLGCYAITDEADCLAKEGLCIVNRGFPATCTANVNTRWCLAATERVFLGCRPFTDCKAAELIVAREVEGKIEAYWSERCIPPGFGPATPTIPFDAPSPPPACDG